LTFTPSKADAATTTKSYNMGLKADMTIELWKSITLYISFSKKKNFKNKQNY